ncbi:MAG: LuxR C-terminal-related transcriptional regulator [Raoultibacter sp.]
MTPNPDIKTTLSIWDTWVVPIGIGLRWGVGFAIFAISINFPSASTSIAIPPMVASLILALCFFVVIPVLRRLFSSLFNVKLAIGFGILSMIGIGLMVGPPLWETDQSLQMAIGSTAYNAAQWFFLVFGIDYFRTSSPMNRAAQLLVTTSACGIAFLLLINVHGEALLGALFGIELVIAIIIGLTAKRLTKNPREKHEAFIALPQSFSLLYGMLVGCIVGLDAFKQSTEVAAVNALFIAPCIGAILLACVFAKRLPGSNIRIIGYCTASIIIFALVLVFSSEPSLRSATQGVFVASWLLAYNVNALGVRSTGTRAAKIDHMYIIFFGPLLGWIPIRIITTPLMQNRPDIVIGLALFSAIAAIIISVIMITHFSIKHFELNRQGEIASFLESQIPSIELQCAAAATKFDLSIREQEVLYLLATGRGRKYIGEALFIAEGTVKTHVSSIYSKLNIHSREELISLITEENLKQTTNGTASKSGPT